MGSLKMTEKAPGTALPESSCAYLLQELKVHRFISTSIYACHIQAKMLTELYGA
jgi:hypothetical protein